MPSPRTKTKRQKKKNLSRKKRLQASKSAFQRLRETFGLFREGPSNAPKANAKKAQSVTRRKSKHAVPGVVTNLSARRRMPLGMEHLKVEPKTNKHNASSNLTTSQIKKLKKAGKMRMLAEATSDNPERKRIGVTMAREYLLRFPGSPSPKTNLPSYRAPAPKPFLPKLDEFVRNAPRLVEVLRESRGTLPRRGVREAVARPLNTGYAEPNNPNYGLMREAAYGPQINAFGEYIPSRQSRQGVLGSASRLETPAEARKREAWEKFDVKVRTGEVTPAFGYGQRKVKRSTTSPTGSVESTESARREGRRRLTLVEEDDFKKRFPAQFELLHIVKTGTPEQKVEARKAIRELLYEENANMESLSGSEGYAVQSYVPSGFTGSETYDLTTYGREDLIEAARNPDPVAAAEARIVAREFLLASSYLSDIELIILTNYGREDLIEATRDLDSVAAAEARRVARQYLEERRTLDPVAAAEAERVASDYLEAQFEEHAGEGFLGEHMNSGSELEGSLESGSPGGGGGGFGMLGSTMSPISRSSSRSSTRSEHQVPLDFMEIVVLRRYGPQGAALLLQATSDNPDTRDQGIINARALISSGPAPSHSGAAYRSNSSSSLSSNSGSRGSRRSRGSRG